MAAAEFKETIDLVTSPPMPEAPRDSDADSAAKETACDAKERLESKQWEGRAGHGAHARSSKGWNCGTDS